jgi:hypothetical protein
MTILQLFRPMFCQYSKLDKLGLGKVRTLSNKMFDDEH